MTLYVTDFGDDVFLKKYVPQILSIKLKEELNPRRDVSMDKYLKDNYNTSILDVIDCACKNIESSKRGKMYMIGVSDTAIEQKSGERVSTLIRLIDFGAGGVRGLHLFADAVESIKHNFRQVYQLYQSDGGK
jgi:hypothetical protein